MKSKGFVFVETIIVIVVLTFGMIMVYSSFSSILNNDKRRATYNDISYIYRTYYIQDFITSLNLEDFIQKSLLKNNRKMTEFSCDADELYKIDRNEYGTVINKPISEEVKQSFCNQMLLSFNVSKIYISKYDVSELKKCTTNSGKTASQCKNTNDSNTRSIYDALNALDSNTVYYLRTISVSKSDKQDDDYRLIIIYNDVVIDRDKSVYKVNYSCSDNYDDPVNMTCKKCPDGYETIDSETCGRTINRSYYSTIKVIRKSAS